MGLEYELRRVPGRIGGRNKNAQDFWDRMLSIEDTAKILAIGINEIKDAVYSGGLLRGVQAPAPGQITSSGRIFFEGHIIRDYMERKARNDECQTN